MLFSTRVAERFTEDVWAQEYVNLNYTVMGLALKLYAHNLSLFLISKGKGMGTSRHSKNDW